MSLRKTCGLFGLAAVALWLAACGGSPAEEQGGQVAEESGLPAGAEITPPAGPGLSSLEAERLVIAPGETAVFQGAPALQGSLTLRGPSGLEFDAVFQDGRAQVAVPADAENGRYVAVLEAQDGAVAMGEVFVVTPPGVWLEADLLRPGSLDVVTLRVVTNGLPEDAWAFVGLGEIDWASELSLDDEDLFTGDEQGDFFDAGDQGEAGFAAEDAPRAFLVPRDDGLLVPTLQPDSRLAAFAQGQLLLLGAMADTVQVVVSPGEDEDLILSNRVDLRTCESPGTVSGQVNGEWGIRVLYRGPEGVQVADQMVEDGAFALQVPAGPVSVVGVPFDLPAEEDAPLPETRAVRAFLPCGGSIEVDLEAGAFQVTDQGEETETAPAGGSEGEGLPAVGQVSLQGAIQGTFAVEAICQQEEEGLEVLFSTTGSSEWEGLGAMDLLLDGEPSDGTVSGTVRVVDDALQRSEGPVEAEVTLVPGDFLQEMHVRFSGSYAGEAGSGEVEGEFGCLVLGGSGMGKAPGLASLRAGGARAPVAQAGGGGPCRRAYVRVLKFGRPGKSIGAEDQFAARLSAALPRLTAFGPGTAPEAAALPGGSVPKADFEVAGVSGEDILEYNAFASAKRGTDQTVIVSVGVFSEERSIAQAVVDLVAPKLAGALADAAICGQVDPASFQLAKDEERDVTVKVTNLAGEGVDDAEVQHSANLKCGEVDPEDGETDGGSFNTEYKAEKEGPCLDTLAFDVDWDGPHGQVSAASLQAGAEVFGNLQMQGQYDIPMTGMSASMDVKACQTGPTGPWRGKAEFRLGVVTDLVGDASQFAILLGVGEDVAQQLLDVVGDVPKDPLVIPVEFTMPERGGRVDFGIPGWFGNYFPEDRLVVVFTKDGPLFTMDIVPLPEGSPCP